MILPSHFIISFFLQTLSLIYISIEIFFYDGGVPSAPKLLRIWVSYVVKYICWLYIRKVHQWLDKSITVESLLESRTLFRSRYFQPGFYSSQDSIQVRTLSIKFSKFLLFMGLNTTFAYVSTQYGHLRSQFHRIIFESGLY